MQKVARNEQLTRCVSLPVTENDRAGCWQYWRELSCGWRGWKEGGGKKREKELLILSITHR